MLQRLSPLLKLSAAAFACLVLIDIAVFRSGWYAGWIRPDSTAGSVVATMIQVNRYREAGRKNILVLGNSKIGEGFSAPMADVAAARPDLHFVNGSVAGTTPRIWNYLLRALDPHHDRFAAIVMMVDYDPTVIEEDFVNYPLDTSYLRPLLGLRDLAGYPASFTDPDQVARARRAILLPMQAMHDDIGALLESPRRRYKDIIVNRPIWLEAVIAYGGREESLPSLIVEPATGLPGDWGTLAPARRADLEGYFARLRRTASSERQSENQRYLDRWLGEIAGRYRPFGVPVIVFSVPRGPWHQQLAAAPQPGDAIEGLVRAGALIALPGSAFVELEQPQFFFDSLHMNRAGRERFSQMLAAQIAPLVH